MGTAPSKNFVDKINKKILSYEGIIGLHDLAVHNYGYKQSFASVHCEVPADQDILESHDIIDKIERDFHTEMNVDLVIHLDPVVTNDDRTNEAKEKIKLLINGISPLINFHDFRVVWGNISSKFIFDVVLPFEFEYSDEEVISLINEKIRLEFTNVSAVITIDHI